MTVFLAARLAPAHAIEPDALNFMPVDEVERGMKGFGLTVFEGTRIDTFQVEILGVERGSWPKKNIVWGRMEGGPLEKTGIIAGMSGSPVYIDDRLLGAVAFGWGAATEPLCGITPIGEMLEEALDRQQRDRFDIGEGETHGMWQIPERPWDSPPLPSIAAEYLQPSNSTLESGGATTMIPVSTPLMISGFDGETFGMVSRVLGRMGFVPMEGGGGESRTVRESPQLEPGSSVGVQLIRGDFSAAALGTLTHRDGDNVIAFGHAMRSFGDVDWPMATMDVHFVVPSIFVSFKFGSVIEAVGRVAQDRSAAISGVVGSAPTMIAMNVDVESPEGTEDYHYEIVRDRMWTPGLAWYTVVATIGAAGKLYGDYSVGLEATVDLAGHEPLAVRNMFSSNYAPSEAAFYIMKLLSTLLENEFEEVYFEDVALKLSLIEKPRTATLESIRLNKDAVRPGESLQITLLTRPVLGEVVRSTVDIRVPEDMPEGVLEVRVYDAHTARLVEQRRAPAKGRPKSMEGLLDFIEELPRNNELIADLLSRRPGATVGSVELVSLPASRMSVLRTTRQSGEMAATQGTIVATKKIPMDVVVRGQRSLPVRVDRRAR